MKKITLTIIAALVMSTGAMAKWYPPSGPDSYDAIQEQKASSTTYLGSPYLGIAYSYMNANVDVPQIVFDPIFRGLDGADIQGDNLSIIGGYDFHKFLAVEGRYSKTMGDLDFSVSADGITEGATWGGNMTNVGLYFKPKYTSSSVTLYALLGMGHIKIDFDNVGEDSKTEFQWGAGISIDGGNGIISNSKMGLFVDYVRLYDNEFAVTGIDKVVVDMFTVGLTFQF